jgi:hypothetical protein
VSSSTTHERLQRDPSEWYLYHTLYREARATWPENPVTRFAAQIGLRPEWVVGDFGCGECLLQAAVPNRMVGLDHVAWDPTVIAGDMAASPLEAASLDVAVFSLSLMGTNWRDYLREAHRTLKPHRNLEEPLTVEADSECFELNRPGASRSAASLTLCQQTSRSLR